MQLAASATVVKISEKARTRFTPEERRCWDQSEINLHHLSYDDDYRYEMTNCLFEAAMQEASQRCHCIPGRCKWKFVRRGLTKE